MTADIPIAVKERDYLPRFGRTFPIKGFEMHAVAFQGHGDGIAGRCIWVKATYRGYRDAWDEAARWGLVDELATYGTAIDVDHLLAKRWAKIIGLPGWWLRLWPTYREVNRSAGAGREKSARKGEMPRPVEGVIFSDELQWLKIIGHPVGTAIKPETLS